MNSPKEYNFPPHYNGDARRPISMVFTYPATGNPLQIKSVRMQLTNSFGDIFYEFSSEEGKDELLEIQDNKVLFPKNDKWKITPNTFLYDLEITNTDNQVITVLRGKWEILKDITK